jgi:glyoxylase-like metal-dependent hydrolase (beta-lactamase superfamily II)
MISAASARRGSAQEGLEEPVRGHQGGRYRIGVRSGRFQARPGPQDSVPYAHQMLAVGAAPGLIDQAAVGLVGQDAAPPVRCVELWLENRAWLQPDHVNADLTSYVGARQTWVLRSEGKTILVDTGAGNGKDRPLATFAHLHTSFLADLAAAGVAPQDVDVVVNTHLHLDHTGWNTQLQDGQRVPTFPTPGT